MVKEGFFFHDFELRHDNIHYGLVKPISQSLITVVLEVVCRGLVNLCEMIEKVRGFGLNQCLSCLD